jgi:hypothetical protein
VTIFRLLFLLGRSPRYPWGRRRVGPRADMDTVEKRVVSCPCRQSNRDSSATQPVAIEMNGCAGLLAAGCARTSSEHSVELCRSSYFPHMARHGSGGWSSAARSRAQFRPCGICGVQSGTEASPSTSVSPANSHSTDCSTLIIIYHPGLVQQPK